jgi:hypothetical protein
VTNSTLSGNDGDSGGGITNDSGTATVTNTIVAGNMNSTGTSPDDLLGTITSGGHNLIGDTGGSRASPTG